MCNIISAASVQITFDDNVIHYPTSSLLFCCFLPYFPVSFRRDPDFLTSALLSTFPHHSNSVLSTQLSACSHQHVTADIPGTASASEI